MLLGIITLFVLGWGRQTFQASSMSIHTYVFTKYKLYNNGFIEMISFFVFTNIIVLESRFFVMINQKKSLHVLVFLITCVFF